MLASRSCLADTRIQFDSLADNQFVGDTVKSRTLSSMKPRCFRAMCMSRLYEAGFLGIAV